MINPTHLTAFEHQDLLIGVPDEGTLSPREVDMLCALNARHPRWCDRGHRSVRFNQYCGLVALDGRMLEILPKLDDGAAPEDCRGVLLRLLRIAGELPELPQQSASHHLRSAPLLEVFIQAFLAELAAVVRGGLVRRYQEHSDDLTCIRGAIQLQRQLTVNANRVDRLACRFDEFTSDNLWNGLVKAALVGVRSWMVGDDTRRLWTTLMSHFSDIEVPLSPLWRLTRLVYDRQGHRYRAVLRWVEVILRLLSPDLRAGRACAPALLFDMNKLFEAAVTCTFRRATAQDGLEVVAQSASTFLAQTDETPSRREFQLRPDLLVNRDGCVLRIADCKWKWLDVSTAGYLVPAQADVYQMHAYASRFNCTNLLLIYPWHESYAPARFASFQLPLGARTARLQITCVDIGRDGLPTVPSAAVTEARRTFGA